MPKSLNDSITLSHLGYVDAHGRRYDPLVTGGVSTLSLPVGRLPLQRVRGRLENEEHRQ